MPAERSAKASTSKAASDKYKKPAKKVQPELPVSEKIRKRWKSIKDQVADGYLEHALENCSKILELEPENEQGNRVYIQLLLSLDRYADALKYIDAEESRKERWAIERSYALYKRGRELEADEVLQKYKETGMDVEDEDEQRTVDVLDAQIKYRLDRFQDAQMLYEDLLATADPESPEYADLQTNLEACTAFLEFKAKVPSLLGELISSHKIPSIDTLETTPVSTLLASHTSRSAVAATGTSSTPAAPKQSAKKSKAASAPGKKVKLPPSIAALPEGKRPAPDPERWLPKRERKGYADILAQREKEKEKKRLKARKKLEASMTQGAAAASGSADTESKAQTPQASSGSSSKPKNKKKGKK